MNETIKKIDEIMNDSSLNLDDTYAEIKIVLDNYKEKQTIQAEQKGPCEYCGSLAALYQISTNGHPDYQYYEPKYCPECGRPLNQKAEEK